MEKTIEGEGKGEVGGENPLNLNLCDVSKIIFPGVVNVCNETNKKKKKDEFQVIFKNLLCW